MNGTEDLQFIDCVENDTQPQVTPTYTNVDVSAFEVLRLHILYKPFPVTLNGVVSLTDNTTFSFPVLARAQGVVTNLAVIGATSLAINITDGQQFSALPSAGEIWIRGQHILYTAVSGSGTSGLLTLAEPLTCAVMASAPFTKLPDYRRGNWPTLIETVDASGERLTFDGLTLRIQAGT